MYINNEDKSDFLEYILKKEKELYVNNPMATGDEIKRLERSYKGKVEEVSRKIAGREGIPYED